MNLCQMCPKPGSCCRGFVLSDDDGDITFWKSSWREDTVKAMEKWGLPFRPAEINEEFVEGDGDPYVTVKLDCPKLSSDGRCTIYNERPEACRNFVPGSDTLCVFEEI
jgi:Fe-S-cluster containining protein